MSKVIRSSAPGKLMLLGEHAVMYGHPALVAAINRRLRAELVPGTGRAFRIHSGADVLEGQIGHVTVTAPFTFVTAALRRLAPPTGFELRLTSELGAYSGLGSSAAVTVAVVAALRQWQGKPVKPAAVFRDALAVVRAVQGTGSGADVAASAFGGLVYYRRRPAEIRPLPAQPPLFAVYSGAKADTATVIAQVAAAQRRYPRLINRLFHAMGATVLAALPRLAAADWPELGRLFNVQQGLLEALGVSSEALSAMALRLREDPGVFGAKLSGAGLGDCLVGLGRLTRPAPGLDVLDLAVEPAGVTVSGPD